MIASFDSVGLAEPSLQDVADRLLSRVLDCAVFYRWRHTCTGSRIAYYQLVKALPGLPVGMVLSLPDLHERLMGEVR